MYNFFDGLYIILFKTSKYINFEIELKLNECTKKIKINHIHLFLDLHGTFSHVFAFTRFTK